MLRLIIRQTNWGIIGSVFAFAIGFFIKQYVQNIVQDDWGMWYSASVFVVILDTLLSLGISTVILKFFPTLLKKNPEKASFILNKILRYALVISFIFIVLMYFFSDLLDIYIFPNIDDFSNLLFYSSFLVPISIFTGIIIALYRSVLKIKEIMIYKVFIPVPLRAVLVLLVFQYTSDILYFIFIEIFTQFFMLLLMYYFFNKKEFKLFNRLNYFGNIVFDSTIYHYGQKMYFYSLINLFSTQGLPVLVVYYLDKSYATVYAILLLITGLSMFINRNLKQIFAPIISKLYDAKDMIQLDSLYKNTAFILNFLTIPFSMLIIFFSDEILLLFTLSGNIEDHKFYLFILLFSRMFALIAGNSGAFMTMAGIEKKEIIIQLIRGIISFLVAIFLIKEYQLLSVVLLVFFSIVYVTVAQLISIKRAIDISPFSRELVLLLIFSIPLIYFSMSQNIEINIYHYVFVPIGLYFIYSILFFRKLRKIYFEIKS